MLPTGITVSLHTQIQSGIGRLILREEMKARSNSYADPWTPPRSSASSREALHTAGYEGSLNGCKHNCPSFRPMREGAGNGRCTQEAPEALCIPHALMGLGVCGDAWGSPGRTRGWGGDLCMVQGAQPSEPGCASLAAPRMHYLADSGECTSLHPWGMVLPSCGDQSLKAEPREPCWDWGGVGRRRSPALCQDRARREEDFERGYWDGGGRAAMGGGFGEETH